MNLGELGFDEWFAKRCADFHQAGCGFARISAVDRGAYRIMNAAGEVPAELAGRLAYQAEGPADLPCVGDWVTAQYHNDDKEAIIHRVLPRKSFLRRRAAGDSAAVQMIAANIDTAFIVQSCHFDFNPRRLIMASDGQVEPVVILTKTDLVSPGELESQLASIGAVTKAPVLALSSLTGSGFDEFSTLILPGQTYCLLGSSGVGKTTLINRLAGKDALATGPVSGTGEGTHTTSRRQLIVLERGALLIDTPGMRELGILGSGDAQDLGFEEIEALAQGCRYENCRHEQEPGCAVRAAVEQGAVSAERYASYIKLRKESAYHEMSHLDKRKKDKAFGRFIKSVKKQMKD
ncbi:MAG: putative ribosome biogenesis GTPase RsgA [Deltaproteobacteria bacterium ADurb.Bin510]|nr:MAG: putative ribosome biogenesis GTPase RsgA [Deltaproteobacteria bacterium ADurb.Bin510]